MQITSSCLANVTPFHYWSIADHFPDLQTYSRLHVQVRLMDQFGFSGGIPWLRDWDGAFFLVSKAWFPYDRWRSLTIAGIANKAFSDRNDHMETKFSFCQRSPTIPATANNPSDCQQSQRLPTIATITIAGIKSESISAIIAIVNDRQ